MTTATTRQEQETRLRELGVEPDPNLDDVEIHQLLIRTLSDRLNTALEGDDEPGADIVPAVEPRPSIPTAGLFAHLAQMAEPLSRSNLVKPALRGKPNDVLMILLTSYDLGITMTQGLSKVHVIEGQPAASPELILGLIRREGHQAWPGGEDNCGTEQTDEDIRTLAGVVHAIRKDDPAQRVITVRFTIGQAEQAGLVQIDNNKLRARSRDGKALPWENYPEDLLWARAVSRLGRRNFSDVLLGLSYVPEELGYVDVASTPTPPTGDPDPEMLPSLREELRARIGALPPDVRSELATAWNKLADARALRPLDRLRDSEYAVADDLIRNYEAKAKDAVTAAPAPPCETDPDEVEDQAAKDLTRETGLPFPCEDFEQKATPRTCPTPGQCQAAGECLRSPI
jgi:hypothetical protein